MTDHFVMDANFFISLAHSREPKAIERVLDLSSSQGWVMHVTEPILEEVRYVRGRGSKGTAAEMARVTMKVHPADDAAVVRTRTALGGATHAPQAPDLSLMALSEQLAMDQGGTSVRLVSDDFKISITSRDLGMPYAVISPSVFLFSLSRQLRGSDRDLVRRLYRKVRHGEMEYLLSRRDLYNVEDKLSWLMDNLLQTVTASMGPGASAPTRGAEGEDAAEAEAARQAPAPPGNRGGADWDALMRHLRGEHVRRGHLRPFDHLMPHLEPLEGLPTIVRDIQAMCDDGRLDDALDRAHEELSDLKSQLQLAVGALRGSDGQLVLRAYAELLPSLEMVTALLHVNVGDVVDCEDHLDNVALLALASGLTSTVIEANYLEALVHTYREAWEDALEQFQLTARLSTQHGDVATNLRCLIGIAISQLLSGDAEGAEAKMDEVNRVVEADPSVGAVAFEEFGDHFTNFGAIHLAAGLYSEAMECAVEARATEAAERTMDKLRRSRLSMGLEERDMADAISTLIDHANDIQDAELLARYHEMERELAASLERLTKPLEGTFDEWSAASRLPDALEGWLDVIRADPLPRGEGTVLICYSGSTGNVGLLVRDMVSLPGIEHATVRIGQSAQVKLVEAPEPLRSRHRLRGIVVLKEGNEYELRRALISLKVGGRV